MVHLSLMYTCRNDVDSPVPVVGADNKEVVTVLAGTVGPSHPITAVACRRHVRRVLEIRQAYVQHAATHRHLKNVRRVLEQFTT